MIKLESNIKKTVLEVPEIFMENKKNSELLKACLSLEESAKNAMDAVTKHGIAMVTKSDKELVKCFEEMEKIMGSQIITDDQELMQQVYIFLGNIFLDISEYYHSQKMLEKGMFYSYAKHINSYDDKYRGVSGYLTEYYSRALMGLPVDGSCLFNQSPLGAELVFEIKNKADCDFSFNIYSLICVSIAIDHLVKKQTDDENMKTFLRQTIEMICKYAAEIKNQATTYLTTLSDETYKNTVDSFINQHISYLNDLKI